MNLFEDYKTAYKYSNPQIFENGKIEHDFAEIIVNAYPEKYKTIIDTLFKISIKKGHIPSYNDYAIFLFKQNRINEATEYFKYGIENNDLTACKNLGDIYCDFEKYDDAFACYVYIIIHASQMKYTPKEYDIHRFSLSIFTELNKIKQNTMGIISEIIENMYINKLKKGICCKCHNDKLLITSVEICCKCLHDDPIYVNVKSYDNIMRKYGFLKV
jgi:hypothetical protein